MNRRSSLIKSVMLVLLFVLSLVMSVTESRALPGRSYLFTRGKAPINTDINIDYSTEREKARDIASFVQQHRDIFHLVGGSTVEDRERFIVEPDSPPGIWHGIPRDERPTTGAYQADMMLTNDQWNYVTSNLYVDENSGNPPSSDNPAGDNPRARIRVNTRGKRGVAALTENYWPMGIIPVDFDTEMSSSTVDTIINALKEWSANTCLVFLEHSEHVAKVLRHNTYLKFESGFDSCWSFVGRVASNNQTVSIPEGCAELGTVLHEVGHAVGLHHEQSRPDRDFHVVVHYEDIEPDNWSQFYHYLDDVVSTYEVEYDEGSIMHYGPYAFSKHGGRTIDAYDPNFQNIIGQRERLSNGDIEIVNAMYDCPKDFFWY